MKYFVLPECITKLLQRFCSRFELQTPIWWTRMWPLRRQKSAVLGYNAAPLEIRLSLLKKHFGLCIAVFFENFNILKAPVIEDRSAIWQGLKGLKR